MLLTLSCIILAQTTIIDTIWTENSLQGAIGYHVQNGNFYGGIIPSGEGVFFVGDSYDPYSDYNDISMRAYFSFPLQPIPINYSIDSVYIKVYQATSMSNDQFGFPIWFENQYYPCSLFHVNYGLTFEPDDFNPEVYDSLGAISTNATIEWKMFNITDAYLTDILNSRTYCQLMFKFPILTDYDHCQDNLLFGSSFAVGHPIQVIITYSQYDSNVDDLSTEEIGLSVYPNPCHNTFSILNKSSAHFQKIDLFNIKGQKVLSDIISSNKVSETRLNFDKSTISSGIYILKAQVLSKNKIHTITKRISVHN